MKNKGQAKKGTMKRLIRMLFEFYPGGGSADGDQTGPHPGCTVCAVSGSRLCVFLWNGDYHTGLPEEDAGKNVQPHAGFADQVF